MKGSHSLVLACMLSLHLLVGAQLVGPAADTSAANQRDTLEKGSRRKKGDETTTITLTPLQVSSTLSTSATPVSSSKAATFSTTTNTIDFSFKTSSTRTSSTAVPTSVVAALSTESSSSPTVLGSSSSSQGSIDHRTIIIIISSVLGTVGILLIAGALFLAYRFRQRRTPFGGHRATTPLDDDEIDSWRGTVIEQKRRSSDVDPTMLNRKGSSIQMQASLGWTWTASPTFLMSGLSPTTAASDTPAVLAKAPNSRVGLTDETVPGADPFIPPIKRQSSRLKKAHPGHSRSKSRRSSTSAKSVWSYNGGVGPNPSDNMPMWYDPDDHAIEKSLSRTDRTTNNSPMSIYDDVTGGLSPRPISQARQWDRERGRSIA